MEVLKKEANVQYVRGATSMNADYLDFINLAFGMNTPGSRFQDLLPKLYDGNFDAAASSYFALENGVMKAAAGTLDYRIRVCEEPLLCRTVGNVGVHPESRGRGYMSEMMKLINSDMKRDGIDIGVLAGKRHRYSHFGYEKSGTVCNFHLIPACLTHCFGKNRTARFTYRAVQETDVTDLDNIATLLKVRGYVPCRPREQLYKIMRSWCTNLYTAYENNRFIGFAVASRHTVAESKVCRMEDYTDFIAGLFDVIGSESLNIALPPFERDYINAMYPLCDTYGFEPKNSYLILNFEKMVSAFMKLKSTYTHLPDGKLVLLIHGFGGDERLKLEVKDGKPSVSATEETAERELGGIEATNLLFSLFEPSRAALPQFAQSWLPLPLWMYHADMI